MTSESNTEHVRRTDEGASIEVDITRGTGTRDQEKWKLKGKGATATEALAELQQMLNEVVPRDVTTDEALGDQVRDFQPGGSDD